MYVECTDSGEMGRLAEFESSPLYRRCHRCEERTVWEQAFTGEGVSF
ncbi:MAG: hypothetical protein QXG03_06995 [Halalkalicoccus sp.]